MLDGAEKKVEITGYSHPNHFQKHFMYVTDNHARYEDHIKNQLGDVKYEKIPRNNSGNATDDLAYSHELDTFLRERKVSHPRDNFF